jgi:hypothetical protein
MTLNNADYLAYIIPHIKLLYFVGQQSNLVPKSMDLEEFAEAGASIKAKCRDFFLSDIGLLDDYFSENSEELSAEEISILSGFKKAVTSDFIILKCLSKYAIFIDIKSGKHYAVKALWDTFDMLVPLFPAIVNATLLPYKNMIIYDGFLKTSGISLGPGKRYNLNEEYKKVKKDKQIIEVL